MSDDAKPCLYFGSDHGGYSLKQHLLPQAEALGYEAVDVGDAQPEASDDYPPYALLVAANVTADRREGKASFGVLSCRSAAGMVMAAGKLAGIRAAVAFKPEEAVHARADNDANVLALSGDWTDLDQAARILETFVQTPANDEPRHQRRRAEIHRLETVIPEIIPGVFEETEDAVREKVASVTDMTTWLHIDVADGGLVPRRAFAVAETIPTFQDLSVEAHLMVNDPAKYLAAAGAAGYQRLIGHVEAPGFAEFASAAGQGLEIVGALDLGTGPDALTPYASKLDGVLVMGVKAGKSGQAFDPSIISIVSQLNETYPELPISVDGGVSDRTAAAIVAAGAARLVSTSYLFTADDLLTAMDRLRDLRGGENG